MFDPLRQDPRFFNLALAGAAGGVLRWITLRQHWRDGLIAIVAGIICSVYFADVLAPVLVAIVHAVPGLALVMVDAEQVKGPAGLLSGITGISITGLVIDWVRIVAKPFLRNGGDK